MNTNEQDELFVTLKYGISIESTHWVHDLPHEVIKAVFNEAHQFRSIDFDIFSMISILRFEVDAKGSRIPGLLTQALIKYEHRHQTN